MSTLGIPIQREEKKQKKNIKKNLAVERGEIEEV